MRVHTVTFTFLLSLSFLFFFGAIDAQGNYFQQELKYDIKVELIDSLNLIEGDIKILYKNNAPVELNEIYMHLWANAFKSKTSAFTQQKLRQFSIEFYYAKEEDLGYYEKLEFKVNGESVQWKFDDEHPDIARLELSEPLKSGEELIISTPFRVKIPASFSRLGHIETSYQMTQWYPKPAVFDANGWHPMPYLDMGEFYSEFGEFNVEITLPENYYVAATGELQTQSELERIKERINFTKKYLSDSSAQKIATDFPESSDNKKTLVYRADNVHDFAWFADKRFLILDDKVILDNGDEVKCYAYFTDQESNLWKKGAFYVARAVQFYSDRVGHYPYPHATAVQSALSAGAGMEYPMITVIGLSGNNASLDQVITHEVGHNWFYGILASNERDYPWMDEGMNSYHDHKYMEIYYEDYDELSGILPKRIRKEMDYSGLEYVYHIFARAGKDQAPNTHSDSLTLVNYFIGAYEKPAMAFKYLEKYLGEERFIAAMTNYYDQWKFRHPQPEDVKKSFEDFLEEDLSWLFDGMLFSNETLDYAVKKVDNENSIVQIENLGTINVPVKLSYTKGGEIVKEEWVKGATKMNIPLPTIEWEELRIDRANESLDINPKNNNIKSNQKKGEALSLRFLTGIHNSKSNKSFFLPVFGANAADGFQFGLASHNYGVPLNTFQYYLNPGIGFRSGELIGSFGFRQDFIQKGRALRNISLALSGKSYHYSRNQELDYILRFIKINPEVELEFQKSLVSQWKHFIRYNPIILNPESAQFVNGQFESKENNFELIHLLNYELEKSSPINPSTLNVFFEYRRYDAVFGDDERYIKLFSVWDGRFAYKQKRFVNLRLFGGVFPYNSANSIVGMSNNARFLPSFSLFQRGINDYRFDYHFFNRTTQDGFFTRQIGRQDGYFKNGVSSSYYSFGQANIYMFSANFSVDLPFGWSKLIPVQPYVDAGLYGHKPFADQAIKHEFLYSAGISINFQDVFAIHFPIINSQEISDIYRQEDLGLFQRMSFMIDLNKLDPHRLKRFFTR